MIIAILFLALGGVVVWQFFAAKTVLFKIDRQKNRPGYWTWLVTQILVLLWMWQTGQPLSNLPLLADTLNNTFNRVTTLPTPGPTATLTSCRIASDAEYGRKPEKPVVIGGGDFGGPQRTSLYLQILRGPRGEVLTYKPLGEELHNGQILQKIALSYANLAEAVTIYVDHYHEGEAQAPAGFTCASRFDWPK